MNQEISREGTTEMNVEEISAIVIDTAYHLHRELGPGLLESVYEAVLARMLERRGLKVERQKSVEFDFDGIHFSEGLRIDLLVEGKLVIELKSVESISPVHSKQLLTYLRLMNRSLGLLINFGAATFRECVKRIVNGHIELATSRLRVNQEFSCEDTKNTKKSEKGSK